MPRGRQDTNANLHDGQVYILTKDGVSSEVTVLLRRKNEAYVHYVGRDKRLDEWVPEAACRPAVGSSDTRHDAHAETSTRNPRKRRRGSDSASPIIPGTAPARLTSAMRAEVLAAPAPREEGCVGEEEHAQQKRDAARRNFDRVVFGQWNIKPWYFSPYPLADAESEDTISSSGVPALASSSSHQALRTPGASRAAARPHSRTLDLLTGGLGRPQGESASLWVCDRCFKYTGDGAVWELHVKKCGRKHPPGTKVYQRGAHTIWEVDGAKEKLFCQNLSLFGKLFIDVKTLFFDCDNFLFYLLTDAESQRDHVIGYFSKEKMSYDDYNLACIITLPPYQRKGYGMLMIEFSYELSKRAGKIGTPERPLSDLGLRSYLTYWIATLVRFLRRLLSVVPPEESHIVSVGAALDIASPRSPSRDSQWRDHEDGSASTPRRKRMKGWDGETSDPNVATAPLSAMNDPLFTSLRRIETVPNADGSATSHVRARCTLADVARATHLRVEDAAFALRECGLLRRRARAPRDAEGAGAGEDRGEVLVISREMVEAVARERKVKKMYIDLAHVLL